MAIMAINGNRATAVYSDDWLPFFEALGVVTIDRATDVEFENGLWVARLRSNGQVIATGKKRSAVIQAEVDFLNNKLARGF